MATVPIVTEVTYSQLLDLIAANALNEGLQYSITDQGWLLVATSNHTLKANTGTLIIQNGTILNTNIVADTVLIFTGLITDDIETIPIEIVTPANYIPIMFFLKTHNDTMQYFAFKDSDDGELYSEVSGAHYSGYYTTRYLNKDQFMVNSNLFVYASGNDASGFELIVRMDFSVFI